MDCSSSWAETAAAYRFLRNGQVSWDKVLAPHWQASQVRMAQHRVVLCIQDTTELDYNAQAIKGLGPLSFEAERGLYRKRLAVASCCPPSCKRAWHPLITLDGHHGTKPKNTAATPQRAA